MSKFTDFTNVATRPSSGLFLIGYEGTEEKRIETPALLAGLAELTPNKSLALTPDALTGSSELSSLSIAQTWNTAGAPTALLVNITDTASDAASKLLDLQVGGNFMFQVNKDGTFRSRHPSTGALWTIRNVSDTANMFVMGDYSGSGFWMQFVRDTASIQFGAAGDVTIQRGGANTVKLGTDHATTPTAQAVKAHDVTTGVGADLNLSGGTGNAGSGRVKAMTNFGIPALTYTECTANAQYTDLVIITDVSSTPALHQEVTSGGGNIGILCLRSKGNKWIAISEFDFEFVI